MFNVLSKNKEIVKKNQMKIVIFTGVKIRCMLHGRVFVIFLRLLYQEFMQHKTDQTQTLARVYVN